MGFKIPQGVGSNPTCPTINIMKSIVEIFKTLEGLGIKINKSTLLVLCNIVIYSRPERFKTKAQIAKETGLTIDQVTASIKAIESLLIKRDTRKRGFVTCFYKAKLGTLIILKQKEWKLLLMFLIRVAGITNLGLMILAEIIQFEMTLDNPSSYLKKCIDNLLNLGFIKKDKNKLTPSEQMKMYKV